jgi:hypothetical protein
LRKRKRSRHRGYLRDDGSVARSNGKHHCLGVSAGRVTCDGEELLVVDGDSPDDSVVNVLDGLVMKDVLVKSVSVGDFLAVLEKQP